MQKTEKTIDPLKVASNVYKFLNENEGYVFSKLPSSQVILPKCIITPSHVVYALSGGRMSLTSEEKLKKWKSKQVPCCFSMHRIMKRKTLEIRS